MKACFNSIFANFSVP